MSATHFWRMTKGKIVEGVFAINKPTNTSSAQVLRDLQRHFNPSELFAPWIELEKNSRERENHNQRKRRKDKKIQVKIGHGGTLDPLATGVLITGIGKGTKSLQDFLLCTKVYEAVVLFGTSTDTYDRVGRVLGKAPYEHVTKDMVEKALGQFRGKFMQLPPLYSALKMNGKPLYEYAREGKEIPREIERREVEVLDLELVEWMEGGMHLHKPPTDEAGHAEINLARKVWKQESVLPASTKVEEEYLPKRKGEDSEAPDDWDALVDFERKKRKLSEDQDDLVTDRPPSKRKAVQSSQDATMSGGLPPPRSEEVGGGENVVKLEEGSGAKSGEVDALKLAGAGAKEEEEVPAKSEGGDGANIEEVVPANPEGGVVKSEGANEMKTEEEPTSNDAPKATIEKSPTPSPKGPPAAKLRMTVTSGFYVRSLCHDLGAAVGSAALMAELVRTRQGEFELGKNVLEYADLAEGEKIWAPKVEAMLDEWEEKEPTRPREVVTPRKGNMPARREERPTDRGRSSAVRRNSSSPDRSPVREKKIGEPRAVGGRPSGARRNSSSPDLSPARENPLS